ncbi:MAG TPA: TolC family protein [Rectinemataceae bacterium]|nr:TolC family protein [Rectinemataceae bacterium]
MKTTTNCATLFLVAALVAAAPSQAQSVAARVPAPADELTLQEARDLTLSRSALLAKARLAVDGSGLVSQAQAYSGLPQISATAEDDLGYSPTGSPADTNDFVAKIAVSQTLFDGGKNAKTVRKYDLATESSRRALEATRLSLLGQVDAAYFAVLEDEAAVQAAQSDLESAQLKQRLAQAKADAAVLAQSAVLQTEADTAAYQTALLIARKNLASARAKLASLTGLPASTRLQAVDFSSYAALLDRLGALDESGLGALAARIGALARASSPSLAGYSLALSQAELGLQIARAAYLPSVSLGLSGGLSYSLAGSGSAARALSLPGSLSLTARMDLDYWTLNNGMAAARITAAQADADVKQGESDLDLQVLQALYEWVSSAASIGSSSKALEYAQSSYQNVLEQYRLSAATTADLTAAEATVSVDQTALIAARYGFLANLSALAVLAGLEDNAQLTALLP